MKKRIIFFIMAAFLLCFGIYAQEVPKYGTSFMDAISVTPSLGYSVFTDIRDTERNSSPFYSTYVYRLPTTGQYQWTEGRVVFYRLQTTTKGEVTIHNWGSNLGYTTLFLVRPIDLDVVPGVEYNCDSVSNVAMSYEWSFYDLDKLGAPDNALSGQGYVHVSDLPAGIYYIIVGGYQGGNAPIYNGKICTTIQATMPYSLPDEPENKPEETNNSPIQYRYNASGNRIQTIKNTKL